jgi:phospholipid/cholesterol/gamma-HCH transport system substrate-binding protein
LLADPGAGLSMTQAARDTLRRVDGVLADNADALKNTISNLRVFTDGLARNTGKLDGIVAGLEKMTGGGAAAAPKTTYDLRAVQDAAAPGRALKAQLGLPEPTAVAMLQTQRFLFSPARELPAFAEAMWADSLPKLLQARLIEGFENYDIAHAPLRAADATPPDVQLVLDLRRFEVATDGELTAVVALSARLLDKDGKVKASRLFEQQQKLEQLEPVAAVAAFNGAFGRLSKELIGWTATAM